MSENESIPVPETAAEAPPAPSVSQEAIEKLAEKLSGRAPVEASEKPAASPSDKPAGERREGRPPREPRGDRKPGDRNRSREGGPREGAPREGAAREGGNREGNREHKGDGKPREGGRRDDRGNRGSFRPDFADIEYDKLVADSLYLDNQAHAVVARMRDMDSGTRSQLRRFYNAVRRACQTPEADRQHEFVMLRARLAYTIARHSLRSLDSLERLLLQVTRKNEARGYERFRDLFEAIIAYNE